MSRSIISERQRQVLNSHKLHINILKCHVILHHDTIGGLPCEVSNSGLSQHSSRCACERSTLKLTVTPTTTTCHFPFFASSSLHLPLHKDHEKDVKGYRSSFSLAPDSALSILGKTTDSSAQDFTLFRHSSVICHLLVHAELLFNHSTAASHSLYDYLKFYISLRIPSLLPRST